jgi:putative DNA primase/helicase
MTHNEHVAIKPTEVDNKACYDRLKHLYPELKDYDTTIDYCMEEKNYNRINNKESPEYKEKEKEVIEQERQRRFHKIRQDMNSRLHKDEGSEDAVNYILENYNIYTTINDDASEVWFYKDGVYLPNGRERIKEICLEILEQSYESSKFLRIINKLEPRTHIEQEILFKEENKNLIPLKNGIFDLLNNKLIPYSPKYKFFSKLEVSYEHGATCHNFIKFLSEIVDEKDIVNVQEIIGYCLYREAFLQKAIMLVGSGSNGKSKLITFINEFFGYNNITSIKLQDFDKNFVPFNLFGKYINTCSELPSNNITNTSTFKQLTGGDLITCDRKFKTVMNFICYAKLIFSCNEIPLSYDESEGFYRRWKIISFNNKFVKENEYKKELEKTAEDKKKYLKIANPNVLSKISTEEEKSGVLNWVIQGLKNLMTYNDFTNAETTRETKEKYNKWGCSSERFSSERLEYCFNNIIPTGILMAEYSKFCNENELKQDSPKKVYGVLRKRNNATVENKMINGDRVYVMVNVKIKNNDYKFTEDKNTAPASKQEFGINDNVSEIDKDFGGM